MSRRSLLVILAALVSAGVLASEGSKGEQPRAAGMKDCTFWRDEAVKLEGKYYYVRTEADWVEIHDGKLFARYEEKQRTEEFVELYDPKRELWIRLLPDQIHWKTADTKWNLLGVNGVTVKGRSYRFAPTAVADGTPAAGIEGKPTAAEVDAYMKKIEASHKKLHDAGREFGKALGPAISGNDADRLALNRQYRRMAQLLHEVLKETKGWKVPDHAAVTELARVNDRFLDYQLEVMLSVLPGALDLAEDSNLSADEKKQKILKLIESGNVKEVEIGTEVKDAMAKAKSEFKLR